MTKDQSLSSLLRFGSSGHDPLDKQGIYYLSKDIDQESIPPVIEWILAHNLADKPVDQLTLIVTSYGGIVDFCFALTDIMAGSAIPIRTVGLGVVSSCGLMIFMAGTKGRRVLTPNTSILSHQFTGGDYGKEHELIAGRKSMDQVTDKVMRHYIHCTGLSEKNIRKYLLPPEDVWLSADEALRHKLCDQIALVNTVG